MALPEGWPPRPAEGRRSVRFYTSGNATANFSDNALLFSDQTTANTYKPLPYVAPGSSTAVAVGDLTVGGTPSGGGQDVHDVNPSVAAAYQGVPHPMIWCGSLRIFNDGANDLEFSFDGTTVQGVVKSGDKSLYYFNRYEAGIAVRSAAGTTFRIEAW
jgi:hypothetical protein